MVKVLYDLRPLAQLASHIQRCWTQQKHSMIWWDFLVDPTEAQWDGMTKNYNFHDKTKACTDTKSSKFYNLFNFPLQITTNLVYQCAEHSLILVCIGTGSSFFHKFRVVLEIPWKALNFRVLIIFWKPPINV